MVKSLEHENDSKHRFWNIATKYAESVDNDESFVNEMAYMMVTLHRTGA